LKELLEVRRIRVITKPRAPEYEVIIGNQVLNTVGEKARFWLGNSAKKIAVISNPTVFQLYGRLVLRSLKAEHFAVSRLLINDGERFKNLETVHQNLLFLDNNRFERTDAILALGGGVVGDIAGFTAAIYLRGIRFVYAPTTLLAQIDSSIGGKTGVNLPRGKNLVGSFHAPAGVLTDVATLKTLPPRELVSGLCECIKQGAVGNSRLFNQTRAMLDSRHRFNADLVDLISAHCKFKATIVKTDEREQLNGTNHRSRRILNFGHTVGHALETVTNYSRFRHGEAVAIGMLAAGEISKNLGLLKTNDLVRLTKAVARCGPLPKTDDLSERKILNAIKSDKKSTSGAIQWVLLEGIGKPRIVSGDQIDPKVIAKSLRAALSNAATLRSDK
jgi:3-dehydroquinate synthase